MEPLHHFRIEISSDDPRWGCCHVVITAEGLDDAGERCGHYATENFEAVDTGCPPRRIALEGGPCRRLDTYLYIIPHTLPESSEVDDTPTIAACMSLYEGKTLLRTEPLEVNPWGGLTRHLILPKEE